MRYIVMKLDLHILIVTLHIYVRFQANTFSSFRNIQIRVKIEEYTLTLSQEKGSAHPLVELNILTTIKENILIRVELTERTRHNV